MSDELRAIFDEDAWLYDQARPGYPSELLADLLALCRIRPGSRVLEIGPGTGQATLPLADLGASVTAVELGAGLAEVLRGKVAGRDVEVAVSSFEEYPLPEQPFAAVVAFTAWHWLESGVRAEQAAYALRGGGHLATVTTLHVAGGTESFFEDVQRCYERWDPDTPPGLRPPTAGEVVPIRDEVDGSPLFAPAVRVYYEADIDYGTAAYLDVLRTYSGHRALAADQRHGLLDCIGDLIDHAYGGTITKRYLYELRVARAREPPQDRAAR